MQGKIASQLPTVIALSVIGMITILPICFVASERTVAPPKENEVKIKVKDMIN